MKPKKMKIMCTWHGDLRQESQLISPLGKGQPPRNPSSEAGLVASMQHEFSGFTVVLAGDESSGRIDVYQRFTAHEATRKFVEDAIQAALAKEARDAGAREGHQCVEVLREIEETLRRDYDPRLLFVQQFHGWVRDKLKQVESALAALDAAKETCETPTMPPDLHVALIELSAAMHHPAMSVKANESFEGELVRMATRRLAARKVETEPAP